MCFIDVCIINFCEYYIHVHIHSNAPNSTISNSLLAFYNDIAVLFFDFPFLSAICFYATCTPHPFASEAVQGPAVEFFNPKMRRELEKRDEEIKRASGKGNAPGADDWSYLNSFSRVPVSTFH